LVAGQPVSLAAGGTGANPLLRVMVGIDALKDTEFAMRPPDPPSNA
jgi:hypothetical protein